MAIRSLRKGSSFNCVVFHPFSWSNGFKPAGKNTIVGVVSNFTAKVCFTEHFVEHNFGMVDDAGVDYAAQSFWGKGNFKYICTLSSAKLPSFRYRGMIIGI